MSFWFLLNLLQPGSLYNCGMKPLMHSELDAKTRKIGWRRLGEEIKYYKNDMRWVKQATKISFFKYFIYFIYFYIWQKQKYVTIRPGFNECQSSAVCPLSLVRETIHIGMQTMGADRACPGYWTKIQGPSYAFCWHHASYCKRLWKHSPRHLQSSLQTIFLPEP